MNKDNEKGKKRYALHLSKTTISNLTKLEMNLVLGGYSFHTEPCNERRMTSGLPSCPDFPG